MLKRINDTGFNEPLEKFVENGGLYVGVSAGSVIAAANLPDNLGYIKCKLDVHGQEGINVGEFEPSKYTNIKLPDYRAIIIQENNYEVIE